MRTAFPLSTHPAVFLLPPGVVLTVLFGLSQGIRADTSGYWVGVFSSATAFAVFSCTFAALGGALSANRLRRGRITQLAPARSSLQIAAAALWPSVVLGVVLQAIGVIIAATGSWGAPGRLPLEILFAWAVMIVFHSVLGYALGLTLPTLLGVSTAVLVSYVWLGFTWSVSFTPLRYLAGLALAGCCSVYAELPWQAPATVVLFSAAGTVAIALLLSATGTKRSQVVRVVAAAVVMTVAVPASLLLARDLGPYPSPPRASDDLVCTTEGATEVCLYPEQLWAPVTTDIPILIAEALARLDSAGILVPARVTAALLDDSNSSISLIYRRDFDAAATVNSLMTSITPQRQEGDDCARDDLDPTPALFAADVAVATMFVLATGDTESLTAREPETAAAASALLRLDASSRATWINSVLDALGDCSLPVPWVPVPLA